MEKQSMKWWFAKGVDKQLTGFKKIFKLTLTRKIKTSKNNETMLCTHKMGKIQIIPTGLFFKHSRKQGTPCNN